MFYRFNDNDQWTNLYVPFPRVGLHRAVTLEFDYARPNRLYATVDSETSYGGLADHLGPKWLYYVTDDWGQTWTELEQYPLGMDECKNHTCHSEIGLPKRDQYIVRMPMGTRSITVPVIRNYVTGEVDSTMGKSLLSLVDTFLPHGYDSVKNVRFSLLTFPNIDCIDVGFLMLHYDSLVGGKYILRSNWVVTTNSGASWIHALSDVSHSVRHLRLPINTTSAYSCTSQAIYSTYGLGRIASDGRSETYETGVLRISLNATATSAPLYTEISAAEVVVFPNPTSDFVTVNARTIPVSDASTITIVNSLGQTCNDSIVITPQSDDSFTIDVRRLAAGMYRVILNVGGTFKSVPFIVQR
jgi:hypothetical protein